MPTPAQTETRADAGPAAVDIAARNERVMSNQGLVHTVARTFRGRGVELEDLVQFGNLGLMAAAERFDPGRKIRFSTYAVYWIRQAIFRGIASTGRPIRVPTGARADAKAVFLHEKTMGAAEGVAPTLVQVVADMESRGDHTPDRSERLLRAAEADRARFGGSKPLDEMPHADGSASPLSALVDDEHREQIQRAMALLPDEQREVLVRRYGLNGGPPLSASATAALLGIGWSTAEKLEDAGIRELRRLLGRG